ncbi:MAG: DEAD/DEAH box helicase, partial [Pseudomonadota bacterium]
EESNTLNCLSEQDRKICAHIDCEYSYYGAEYSLDSGQALEAAVDHPLVFWLSDPEQPVEIVSYEPQLNVREQDQELLVQLNPSLNEVDEDQDFIIERETQQRLCLTRLSPQHKQIANILGKQGLTVPKSAESQVLQSLSAIAPLLPIQSDIGGGSQATEREADTTLYMHIQPQQDGLKFDLAIQPLGPEGPRFRPGEGRTMVMAEVKGERVQTSRPLEQERQQHQQLCTACSALSDSAWDSHHCEWLLEGDAALEALYQLQDCGELVELLWPKGGALRLSRETGLSQMQASVRQHQDWFALEGELRLDDGQVLSMSQLLALIEQSPGRFIPLGDDAFLTLTEQLRQRLQALDRHGDKQHYHPLAATALEELTDGMTLDGDTHWQAQTQRIHEAYALEVSPPATLQVELRDYQRDGLAWLTRLAHWGAGACLADDMGLGKTLQSLALIVARAADGPTLILAPTSVCMNWLSEARRFAPTLNPVRFGDGDRQTLTDNAGPYDLVVCSYGLLQTEQQRLHSVHWHTIVADEAQALKNPQTKRTQAAMQLKGNFKMVATGTPIENHLGELWSLFRFINPGLLGSQDSFNQRFANPIENQQDKIARQQLKRLVQPFILRRLKTEVLTELPPRTEITISVPQSQEEAALYEALRRQALEKLANSSQDNSGQQHLKVLAEIMRLRRACCNPRLVIPECTIASSKLEAFGNIVDELRENHHRALVFSQFVDHLALISDYLDQRAIRYQYLDGSTPIKKRERAVDAFQKGEGELFLISLKAGGSGLNLTAADYVVHMDPWWNPAVEDQASDRAHRMGQTRPVTIYRLVSENTIEEKILALHGQKRDLADSLLAGTDSSGKLSVDEVMALIETDVDL